MLHRKSLSARLIFGAIRVRSGAIWRLDAHGDFTLLKRAR
jgi:hypothetical protein